MVKLYDKDGNKLLYDLSENIVKCIVEEERNGLFELTLIYPATYQGANDLIKENIIIANASNTLLNQKFRIYNIRKAYSNMIEVYARHISYDLLGDFIENIEIENQSCEYALNTIFRKSQFSNHYKGYSDIINSQNYKVSMINCLNAVLGTRGSIIDTFGTGAEILRDNENLYVLNRRGHDNDAVISYGDNLTGFDCEEDLTELITRIYPYAKKSSTDEVITLNDKFVDSPRINNYSHPYIKDIGFSDKFEQDEEITQDKLRLEAEKYFIHNNCDIPKMNFKINFVLIEKYNLSLCDVVTIKHKIYNIDTQSKVIKIVFDVIKNRFESMELGEPKVGLGNLIGNGQNNIGVQGPPGKDGADGKPGEEFPDTLPTIPVLSASVKGFASIDLSWNFENKVYYSYQLFASRDGNTQPNMFDLIFEGQGSSFLHTVKPGEVWYYWVRAINSYGKATQLSNQTTVTANKKDDFENYFSSAAIERLVTRVFSTDYMEAGVIKGNWIDAKNLVVTDGTGKRTFQVDSYGRISMDVVDLTISAQQVETVENSTTKIYNAIANQNYSNMIKNGGFEYDLASWSINNNADVNTNQKWNCKSNKTALIYAKGLSSGIYQRISGFEVGKEYTLTFDLATDTPNPITARISIENTIGINCFNRGEFERYSLTFTATEHMHIVTIYGMGEGNFYIDNIMISKGTLELPYIPNVEDFQQHSIEKMTEMKATSDNFQFTIENRATANILKNSSFTSNRGLSENWNAHRANVSNNNIPRFLVNSSNWEWSYKDSEVNTLAICDQNHRPLLGGELGANQIVKLIIGETYTLSFYCAAHRVNECYATVRGNHESDWGWLRHETIIPNEGGSNINNWTYFTMSFTPQITNNNIEIGIKGYTGDDPYMFITKPMLNKGSIAAPYTTNNNEINKGVSTLDEQGLTVSHSSGSSASFNHDGSIWRDNVGREGILINNAGLIFKDTVTGEFTNFMKSSMRGNNSSINGLSISCAKSGDFIALGCSNAANTSDSWVNNAGITVENYDDSQGRAGVHFWSMPNQSRNSSMLHNHTDYIQESGNIYMNNQDIYFDSYGEPYKNWIGRSNVDRGNLCIFGDNKLSLGIKKGDTSYSVIEIHEVVNSDQAFSWCHWDFNNWIMRNMRTAYDLPNMRTKKNAESYGLKSNTNSIRYVFKQKEFKDNKLILNIPNQYLGYEYNILNIVKYGRGDVWISEENENKFILESENNICVNIEIEIIEPVIENRARMDSEKRIIHKEVEKPKQSKIIYEEIKPYWNLYKKANNGQREYIIHKELFI